MTQPTLWTRFADDAFPEALDGPSLDRLEPLWRRALEEVGFEPPATAERFFKAEHGSPYLNLSLLASTLSGGAMRIEPSGGEPGYRLTRRRSRTGSLIGAARVQWRLEKYLALPPPLSPPEPERDRVRSLALGICQQALLLRLPSPEKLAPWLMNPRGAPLASRRTVRLLLRLQKERDSLSPAWNGFFPLSAERASPGPAHFWLGAAVTHRPPSAPARPKDGLWRGRPVCAGVVQAECWIEGLSPSPPPAGRILVFTHARPSHVPHFEGALAVLFAEGGVLSHACSVAREQGLPCATALGRDFLDELLARPHPVHLRVEIDSNGARARLLDSPDGHGDNRTPRS